MKMLTFMIQEKNNKPIYLQLYEHIKSEIQSGRIEAGSKMPSKRKLSQHLAVSQNTVQAAYEQLIEEGYIYSLERKGYYVAEIDHIFHLEEKKQELLHKGAAETEKIIYDFSYQGVDQENFPFSAWRKITKDVINEYDKELLKQGDPQGHLYLRQTIAEYIRQSRGVDCKAEQIVISSGTEYLFQILIQILSQEAVYGIENPGHERLNLLFKSNRANYEVLAIDELGMNISEVRKSRVSVLCVTPSHQFPSGNIMSINRRAQLLNWANERQDRYIIEDDYDSEFKYSGKPIPALQGLDKGGRVIYMGSFSKSLSPALRISYMVLPDELLRIYHKKLSFMICPVSVMLQKVLHRFIEEGFFERHLNKMRNLYKKKREILSEEVSEIRKKLPKDQSLTIKGADAGLHLLLEIINGMSEKELVESAAWHGVKVYPLSKYYLAEKNLPDKPSVLIGYAAMSKEDIVKAFKLLGYAWFNIKNGEI